jgi:hypothetical protein
MGMLLEARISQRKDLSFSNFAFLEAGWTGFWMSTEGEKGMDR